MALCPLHSTLTHSLTKRSLHSTLTHSPITPLHAHGVCPIQLKAQIDDGAFMTPTLMINGEKYLGSLECTSTASALSCGLMGAVCAGFKQVGARGVGGSGVSF